MLLRDLVRLIVYGPASFDHVLGDARLRDFKPEFEQFPVDAWRAPKQIFDAHPPNQSAQLRVDRKRCSAITFQIVP